MLPPPNRPEALQAMADKGWAMAVRLLESLSEEDRRWAQDRFQELKKEHEGVAQNPNLTAEEKTQALAALGKRRDEVQEQLGDAALTRSSRATR